MEPIALSKFKRTYKKFTKKLQERIKREVELILNAPDIGELKKGDLAGIRVYKFKEGKQLYLLAYEEDYNEDELYLYAVGTHDGFYKRFKKYLQVIE
jgi:mRNA-degrading endonuclease RelE of RelBE toxin-antitoxin system